MEMSFFQATFIVFLFYYKYSIQIWYTNIVYRVSGKSPAILREVIREEKKLYEYRFGKKSFPNYNNFYEHVKKKL